MRPHSCTAPWFIAALICEEEESEYGGEYASYHQDEQGEGAAAFKSLVGEEAGNLSNGLIEGPSSPPSASVMRDCVQHQGKAWCTRYAGLLGEIVKGIEKAGKWTWKVIKKAVKSVVNWAKKHYGLWKTVSCGIAGGGAGVLAGAGAGLFTENVFVAGSVGAAVGFGVTQACEH